MLGHGVGIADAQQVHGLHRPIVLLLDLDGNAIEDAENPGEYWAITAEENEANP